MCCIFRKRATDPDAEEDSCSSSDDDLPNAYERLPAEQRHKMRAKKQMKSHPEDEKKPEESKK